jgi:hypothetical protein
MNGQAGPCGVPRDAWSGNKHTRGTLTRMDSLKRLRDEELQSTLYREFGKQLHLAYDHVAKDQLPPRLEELMQRLKERVH